MTFFSDEFRRDPRSTYDRLRDAAPVFRLRDGVFLVLDYETAKRVLADADAFSSAVSEAPIVRDWLIFMDGERHARLRALVTKAFSRGALALLEPKIRAISGALLAPLAARDEFDLVAEYAVPFPLQVIASLLGAPTDDWPRFRRWSDVLFGLASTVETGATKMPGVEDARVEMEAFVRERNLLSDLDVEPNERLGMFQLLMSAGHETTSNLISNSVLALDEAPEIAAQLRADESRIAPFVDEVLRRRSPLQAAFRRARRDVVLEGVTIPAGSLVLPMIGAANADPRHVADPHVAFGHGAHFCIGAQLAKMEARVAIGDLLGLFRRIELVDRGWEPREPLHVHGPKRLAIRVSR